MVTAEDASRALVTTWEQLASGLPAARVRFEDGVFVSLLGVPIASVNGVMVLDDEVDVGVVAAGLDEVAGSGIPYSLHLRPGADASLERLAKARGMVVSGDLPLMVRTDPEPPAVESPLEFSVVTAETLGVSHRVAAAGFEAPEALFAALMSPAVAALDTITTWLGHLDGEPVTTAVTARAGDAVGVFNVATPPAHRRAGHGEAVTAHAIAQAMADGARWAWLQSSAAGYGVYERMGFRTLERWAMWTTP